MNNTAFKKSGFIENAFNKNRTLVELQTLLESNSQMT